MKFIEEQILQDKWVRDDSTLYKSIATRQRTSHSDISHEEILSAPVSTSSSKTGSTAAQSKCKASSSQKTCNK